MLDELYAKWFNKRWRCTVEVPSGDKIKKMIDQYKGVFFCCIGLGISVAVVFLFVEQALYKWAIPFLRRQAKTSSWKGLKLMFISQVRSSPFSFISLFDNIIAV